MGISITEKPFVIEGLFNINQAVTNWQKKYLSILIKLALFAKIIGNG